MLVDMSESQGTNDNAEPQAPQNPVESTSDWARPVDQPVAAAPPVTSGEPRGAPQPLGLSQPSGAPVSAPDAAPVPVQPTPVPVQPTAAPVQPTAAPWAASAPVPPSSPLGSAYGTADYGTADY